MIEAVPAKDGWRAPISSIEMNIDDEKKESGDGEGDDVFSHFVGRKSQKV